jgi:hypothetical protein
MNVKTLPNPLSYEWIALCGVKIIRAFSILIFPANCFRFLLIIGIDEALWTGVLYMMFATKSL